MNKFTISVISSPFVLIPRKTLGLGSSRLLGLETLDDGKKRSSVRTLVSVCHACKSGLVFWNLFPSLERDYRSFGHKTCDVISVTRVKRPYRDWDANPESDDIVPSPVIKYLDDIDTPLDAERKFGVDVRTYERLVTCLSSSEYVYVGWVDCSGEEPRYTLLISDPSVVLDLNP